MEKFSNSGLTVLSSVTVFREAQACLASLSYSSPLFHEPLPEVKLGREHGRIYKYCSKTLVFDHNLFYKYQPLKLHLSAFTVTMTAELMRSPYIIKAFRTTANKKVLDKMAKQQTNHHKNRGSCLGETNFKLVFPSEVVVGPDRLYS